MSQILSETRRTYAAQRGVSQGASITLFFSSGGFSARFECAKRAASVLGSRHYSDFLHPHILIPTEELHKSIMRLSEEFSIALVDTVTDEKGTRFVLVWKITPQGKKEEVALDLDQY